MIIPRRPNSDGRENRHLQLRDASLLPLVKSAPRIHLRLILLSSDRRNSPGEIVAGARIKSGIQAARGSRLERQIVRGDAIGLRVRGNGAVEVDVRILAFSDLYYFQLDAFQFVGASL